MQTFLVILTFSIALGFLLKKFIWDAVFEKKQPKKNGDNSCGKNNCGCH